MSLQDIERVKSLKKEKEAVILGHSYMDREVQLVSDFVGDSYELALKSLNSRSRIILFAGVYFMAEQAAAFNPDKKVLIPDRRAGCSLSDSLRVEDIRKAREEHPQAPVALYVNTSIDCKAEADYIVTSSTAVEVVKRINSQEVIFGPDANLANFVASRTGKRIIRVPERGRCIVHASYTRDMVRKAREEHRDALLMAHPEAPLEVIEEAEFVGSTSQMVNFALKSPHREFIVATEIGMLNALQIRVPEKTFYPLVSEASCSCARCWYMGMITIRKVIRSLEQEVYEVKVQGEVAERAREAFMNTTRLLGQGTG